MGMYRSNFLFYGLHSLTKMMQPQCKFTVIAQIWYRVYTITPTCREFESAPKFAILCVILKTGKSENSLYHDLLNTL